MASSLVPRAGLRPRFVLAAFAVTLLGVAAAAQASGSNPKAGAAPRDDRYASECGACHVPYPPGLLPAASWQQLMSRLDRHVGSDASLDAALAREIGDYLERNAGARDRLGADPATPRITTTRWFLRKHREIAPATFERPDVGSPANCAACHPGAARGDFRERNIHVPH